MTSTLRIIATGGTFDKRYDPLAGQLGFGHTHLPELLPHYRLGETVSYQELMQIDSLDMQETHRLQILDAVRSAAEDQIVIIHGTDTMALTAQTLGAAGLAKTVVLTGAMVPIDLANSDGVFNLGFALGCACSAPRGTYVAMNGKLHAWNSVQKNRQLGIFEAI